MNYTAKFRRFPVWVINQKQIHMLLYKTALVWFSYEMAARKYEII